LKLASILLILIVAVNLQFAYAETKFVSIPHGGFVPGCAEDNTCYDPFEVSIIQGDSVKWTNDDAAAHTVTSGTAQEGPDGFFASDPVLIFTGNMFTHTFDSEPPDDYDYFCLVHPWMAGIIHLLPNAVGGEIIPLDTTALLLGYTILNSYWIAPTAVGIGVGVYLTRNRWQRR